MNTFDRLGEIAHERLQLRVPIRVTSEVWGMAVQVRIGAATSGTLFAVKERVLLC